MKRSQVKRDGKGNVWQALVIEVCRYPSELSWGNFHHSSEERVTYHPTKKQNSYCHSGFKAEDFPPAYTYMDRTIIECDIFNKWKKKSWILHNILKVNMKHFCSATYIISHISKWNWEKVCLVGTYSSGTGWIVKKKEGHYVPESRQLEGWIKFLQKCTNELFTFTPEMWNFDILHRGYFL